MCSRSTPAELSNIFIMLLSNTQRGFLGMYMYIPLRPWTREGGGREGGKEGGGREGRREERVVM